MPYKDREKQLQYWRDYSKNKYRASELYRQRQNEYARRWRDRHPEKSKASHRKWYYGHHEHAKKYSRDWHREHYAQRRDKRRLKDTGASPELFAKLLAEQQGKCAICGKPTKSLRVDHDHHTGQIRGLLCFKCNYGIGILGDTASSLRQAVQYLEIADAARK
jgi:hypothetical protein